jgi:hypothetical protein
VGGALVHPPTTNLRIDQAKTPTALMLEVTAADRPLKSRALVDDLDEQPVLIKIHPQRDLTSPVNERVAHQLADQQLRRVELVTFDRRRAELPDEPPRGRANSRPAPARPRLLQSGTPVRRSMHCSFSPADQPFSATHSPERVVNDQRQSQRARLRIEQPDSSSAKPR